jgi:hypothetical protein
MHRTWRVYPGLRARGQGAARSLERADRIVRARLAGIFRFPGIVGVFAGLFPASLELSL